MESARGKLAALLTMAVAMSSFGSIHSNTQALNPEDIDVTPKQPPIPKGCKEYFFNNEGEFSTEQMRKSECVFKCIASSDKVAIKKFEKWVSTKTKTI